MPLYELRRHRDLDSPLLVIGMEGWIDAGLGAAAAVAHLLSVVPTEVLATFDGDALIDYRARRPTVRISDGLNAGVSWPEIQLREGKDRTGRDVLVLVGPEPDMRWREFVQTVVGLTSDLGIRLAAGLGSFPAPVPHTRPVRLAATATTKELAEKVGYVPATLEVPAGIHAALEQGYAAAGIPAVGIWARVPHYVATMPYPAASAALLEGMAALAGIEVDVRDLKAAAALTATRIEELIAASEEHTAMVSQLEAAVDSEEGAPIDPANLPSGDEIAAELERFLRDQGR